MPHGAPDWGVFEKLSTIYRVTDLGELAARNNVVNTYDRRGNVLWWDDFEDNIDKWIKTTAGIGAAAALSTDTARSGGKSAKLTTGDIHLDETKLVRNLGPAPQNSKYGFEVSFAVTASVQVQLGFSMLTGTALISGGVKHRFGTNGISYLNNAGTWTVLDASFSLAQATTWHTWKLVADTTGTGLYTRLLIDNSSWDLSSLALYTIATVSAGYLSMDIRAASSGAGNDVAHFDDAIITQNEP